MAQMYGAKDPHLAFATMAGAAPAGATKETHKGIRDTYKTANLAILYGQTATGLADRLGGGVEQAREILRQHKQLFRAYHDWSDAVTTEAYQEGVISTRAGWRARVDRGTRWRTWSNYPIQASAADVMRVTTVALDALGVEIRGIVHDGWVLTVHRDSEDHVREAIDVARRVACDRLLGGFPLRMDIETYSDRYRDEKGAAVWGDIMRALPEGLKIEAE